MRKLQLKRGMFVVLAVSIGLAAGCNLVIGNEDRVLREPDAGNPQNRKPDGNDILNPEEGGTLLESGAPCTPQSPELASDGKNCGTCGFDCGGGACVTGKCQPVAIVKTKQPDQVAVVADTLYYTHNEAPAGGVSWCPADDCSQPTLFFNQSTGSYGLAADGAGVVVASPAGNLVYAYPLRYAGTGQSLLSAMPSPVGVAIDATNVWFTTAAGNLYRCPRNGCAGGAVLVAKGTAPGGAVAVGDTFAVWASRRSSPTAPSSEGFVQQTSKLAVDGGVKQASFGRDPRTFVMTGSRLILTAVDGPAGYQGEVTLRPSSLEANESLCQTGVGDPWGVAVDATHVYFTVQAAGEVRRYPIGACTGGQTAEKIAALQGKPRGIAVDDRYVYWANFDSGAVMRLRKSK